jgi:hypothetical protein
MARSLVVMLFLISAPLGAETPGHRIFGPIRGLQSLRAEPAGGGVLLAAQRRWMRLRFDGPRLDFVPAAAPGPVAPADAIPHSRATAGMRDVRLAWLSGGTGRYGHGVLGDAVEAGELRVRTAAGATLRYVLAEEFVFEDLIPRLADIDGDGRDEILLVRSHREYGAAAVLIGIRGGRLALVAESPPIGRANRWLNPVGVADFDADGRNEVAVVETPHIDGTLVLYELEDGKLRETARQPGYSTHVMGSTTLDMASIFDVDGNGVPEIILPTQDRLTLKTVSFANGNFREVSAIAAGSPIAGSVMTVDANGDGRPDIVFWDASARIHVIFR